MSPPSRRSRRRKVKKGSRRSPWPTGSSPEERIDEIMDRVSDVTRRGYAEGAEMLCELAGKLMRSGYEPQARLVWQHARAEVLEWLTTGLELALRTVDPEGALEQLCPLRASWPRTGGRPTKFSSTRPRGKHT